MAIALSGLHKEAIVSLTAARVRQGAQNLAKQAQEIATGADIEAQRQVEISGRIREIRGNLERIVLANTDQGSQSFPLLDVDSQDVAVTWVLDEDHTPSDRPPPMHKVLDLRGGQLKVFAEHLEERHGFQIYLDDPLTDEERQRAWNSPYKLMLNVRLI